MNYLEAISELESIENDDNSENNHELPSDNNSDEDILKMENQIGEMIDKIGKDSETEAERNIQN